MAKKAKRLKGIFDNPADIYELERLKKKGLTYRVPVLKPKAWRLLTKADPAIPRSYHQMRALAAQIFDPDRRAKARAIDWGYLPLEGLITRGIEECGESTYYSFFAGLGNPFLSMEQRETLELDVDADTPGFENQLETDHFIFNWTNASASAADNISDSTIIDETSEHLEHAWDVYAAAFGRTPYVPSGATKIEVVFEDIGGLGVASPPDGPIKFDAASWVSEPGIRQPTSAHELFHKLQYAFGYRTTYAPVLPYKWFSEGSASWAEVFVWQRVSRAYKVSDLFTNPDLNLFDASYRALPFWVFFEARQRSDPTDNPVLGFLNKYESHGIEEQALEEAIGDEWAANNVHNNLPALFALFSRERTREAWKVGPTGAVYGDILGPDDAVLAPGLTTSEIPMMSGDSYANASTVSEYGSDYFLFQFDAGTNGETFSVSVDGSATGDFSYYQVWQKDGAFKRGVFPFGVVDDYSLSEVLTLADANELILIISGRGTGGSYSLTASVS